jgi:large subunit ribosomal protein L6
MSRMGRKPIDIPAGVEVTVDGAHVTAKGPLGVLEHDAVEEVQFECSPGEKLVRVSPTRNTRRARQMFGLQRTLVANMIEGVAKGFEKKLEIFGTGYNVNVRGNSLVLQIGFCHEVVFDLPDGISVEVEQPSAQNDRAATFTIKGIDKCQVGQFAATIRAVRPPEPYKGKGIRYAGEYVRRKEGKAFAGLDR